MVNKNGQGSILQEHIKLEDEMMVSIEKHQVKITIATICIAIIFIISTTITLVNVNAKNCAERKELNDKIDHIGTKFVSIRADIDELQAKANGRDIQLATINTKLANIQTLLIEIKQDMKHDRTN